MRTAQLLYMTNQDDHYLFGQLLLTQLVQRVELAGEGDVVDEPHGCQLHADDDVSVRHHHGHGAEVNLEVLW